MTLATQSSNALAAFLQTSRKFSKDPVELEPVLSKTYSEVAQAVNFRTIGLFETNQITIGDKYFNTGDPQNRRSAFRKTFPFGAIAAGATLTILHGITGIVELVHFYGNCITDASVFPNAKYESLPFVSVTAATEQINLYANDTIITIINGAGNNNIISGTIILEFLLN